jgi:hypothetical protein
MSQKDRERLVAMARNKGFSTVAIMERLVAGTGGDERREIIVEWAAALRT